MCSARGLGKVTMGGGGLFQSLVRPNLRGKDCNSFKHCPLVGKININAFRTSFCKLPSTKPPWTFPWTFPFTYVS